MKKIVVILLALMMVLSLSACDESNDIVGEWVSVTGYDDGEAYAITNDISTLVIDKSGEGYIDLNVVRDQTLLFTWEFYEEEVDEEDGLHSMYYNIYSVDGEYLGILGYFPDDDYLIFSAEEGLQIGYQRAE